MRNIVLALFATVACGADRAPTFSNQDRDSGVIETGPLGTFCFEITSAHFQDCLAEDQITTVHRSVANGNVSFMIGGTVPRLVSSELGEAPLKISVAGSIPEGATLPREARELSIAVDLPVECMTWNYDCSGPIRYKVETRRLGNGTSSSVNVLALNANEVAATFEMDGIPEASVCILPNPDCGSATAPPNPKGPFKISGRVHLAF